MEAMSELHDKVLDLRDAVRELSDVAPDLLVQDAAALSDLQIRLGEIVLQVLEIERLRRPDVRP
jgi:hypothetical protein